MRTLKYIYRCLTTVTICAGLFLAQITHASQDHKHSTALTGFLGLNTVPSARMDEAGTLRAGISTLDPYIHSYIGIQIADPLHINIRQTAEVSNITENPDRLYPGVDLKLRLIEENAHRPEIAIGLQSAFGHKRMAGEYIALSKRYNDFDFTAGLGWGRFGTAGHMSNPLKLLSPHFEKNRDPDNENPNGPNNWFSGDRIGFFAGMEYFLPYDGLSLKLDYGADRYTAEKSSFGYEPGAPWGAGLAYTYRDWASASIGLQGGDKVMGRISLQSKPSKWPLAHKTYAQPRPFYKERNERLDVPAIKRAAENEGIAFADISVEGNSIYAILDISGHAPTPQQIGRAARHIAAYSGQDIEEINITPRHHNLRGTTVKIMRFDVEKALDKSYLSPQELWKNTEFVVTKENNSIKDYFLSTKGIKHKTSYAIILENQLSLSEENYGGLYRSSAIIEATSSPFLGFLTGAALRINLADNLDKPTNLSARQPIERTTAYTQERISFENAYIGYVHSFTPNLHTSILAGYLEEGYSGLGGEILYRPFSSRIAIGVEGWSVTPRQSDTFLNLGLHEGERSLTGHINGWYDLPHHDMTLHARAGQFIAGDLGLSLELEKIFTNGAKLSGSVSVSNYSDTDIYGGTTHAYHALNLSLPLGSVPYIPEGSEIRTKIEPFDRVTGQSIKPPLRLFDMTENFTLDHIAKNWKEVLD